MEPFNLILALMLCTGCGNHIQNMSMTVADSTSLAGMVDSPEIIYKNTEVDYYGDYVACYDNNVIDIGEPEYLSARDKYRNIDTDANIQLPWNEGCYTIALNNGGIKKLSDNGELSDAMIAYQLIEYIPSLEFYKFAYRGFEWDGIMYVSKENGEEYRFRSDPLFSPDHKLCVTVNLDQEGVDETGTIEVYRIAESGFDFLFGLWSGNILPDSACWQDNNTLYLKTHHAGNDTAHFYYYKIALNSIGNK